MPIFGLVCIKRTKLKNRILNRIRSSDSATVDYASEAGGNMDTGNLICSYYDYKVQPPCVARAKGNSYAMIDVC